MRDRLTVAFLQRVRSNKPLTLRTGLTGHVVLGRLIRLIHISDRPIQRLSFA